jgi:electron transport complex protein RnfD
MAEQTARQRPQINLSRTTTSRMWIISICAALAVIQSSLTDSFSSLFIALTAVASAVLTEFFINLKLRTHTLRDGSAVASALVFSLLLPNHISPFIAAAGAVFAMAVVKHSFGGLGTNWVNPALGGWLFTRLSWPVSFDRALEASPLSILSVLQAQGIGDSQGFPLEILKNASALGGTGGLAAGFFASLDGWITPILNSTVFSLAGAELPGGYIGLFAASGSGIIADRGLPALLLGAVLIAAFQVSRAWIPLLFLAFYAFFVRVFGALPFGGGLGGGDMLFGLGTGGVLAAAFLLASDPATQPKSRTGTALIAVLAGLFAFILRYRGGEPYGAFYAVILLNVLVPLIRGLESQRLYQGRSAERGKPA